MREVLLKYFDLSIVDMITRRAGGDVKKALKSVKGIAKYNSHIDAEQIGKELTALNKKQKTNNE